METGDTGHFERSYKTSGQRKMYHPPEEKVSSSSYQRKVTWVTVETGEASPFYLLQAKYFAESFLNASHLLWTISGAKSKQVSEKEDHVLTTFLPWDRY
ncbi:hypothetical protein ElyMa_000990200 [Elysia marginata]|uniref:Uncharacterized protein n=1 Tax=Elysia marginata TaxID=1093978 RepID=A0AAV4HI02_9GAST|nr:hypothetical protein ElyMa_000990200 [Elysia marginata]